MVATPSVGAAEHTLRTALGSAAHIARCYPHTKAVDCAVSVSPSVCAEDDETGAIIECGGRLYARVRIYRDSRGRLAIQTTKVEGMKF